MAEPGFGVLPTSDRMLVALPSAIAFGVLVYSALGPGYAGAGALAGILGAAALGTQHLARLTRNIYRDTIFNIFAAHLIRDIFCITDSVTKALLVLASTEIRIVTP